MSRIGKVFPDLIRDLELKGELGTLHMGPEIFGVVLLDSLESFTAISERAKRLGDWFTQGVLVAPAAGTVMADTLALPIGVYDCQFILFGGNTIQYDVQWRDAANAVTLLAQRFSMNTTQTVIHVRSILEIESVSERFRVIAAGAGVAATDYQASILARAL